MLSLWVNKSNTIFQTAALEVHRIKKQIEQCIKTFISLFKILMLVGFWKYAENLTTILFSLVSDICLCAFENYTVLSRVMY